MQRKKKKQLQNKKKNRQKTKSISQQQKMKMPWKDLIEVLWYLRNQNHISIAILIKPNRISLIEDQMKEMEFTKVIMTLWARWKKPVKSVFTLDP